MNYFVLDAFLVFDLLTDLLQMPYVIFFLRHVMLGVG